MSYKNSSLAIVGAFLMMALFIAPVGAFATTDTLGDTSGTMPIISNCSLNPNVIYGDANVTFTIFMNQTDYPLDVWSIHPNINPPCNYEECNDANGLSGILFNYTAFLEVNDTPSDNYSFNCWVNDTMGNENNYTFGNLEIFPSTTTTTLMSFTGMAVSNVSCFTEDIIRTENAHYLNGTISNDTRLDYCPYGCDNVLLMCSPSPIVLFSWVVVGIIAVILIMATIKRWAIK